MRTYEKQITYKCKLQMLNMEDSSFEVISDVSQWIKNVHRWYNKYGLDTPDEFNPHEFQISVQENDFDFENDSTIHRQGRKRKQPQSKKFSNQNSEENDDPHNLSIIKSPEKVINNYVHTKNYFKVKSSQQKKEQHKRTAENKVKCRKKTFSECKTQITYCTAKKLNEPVIVKEEEKSDSDIMIIEEHLYFGEDHFKSIAKSNQNYVKLNSIHSSNRNPETYFFEQNESTNLPTEYNFICLLCTNQNRFYLVSEKNEIEIETHCLKCYAEHKLVFQNHELSIIKLKISSNIRENLSISKSKPSVQNKHTKIVGRNQLSKTINNDNLIFKSPEQNTNSKVKDTNYKNRSNIKKIHLFHNQNNHCCEFHHQYSYKQNKATSTRKTNSSIASFYHKSQHHNKTKILNGKPSQISTSSSESDKSTNDSLRSYNYKKYNQVTNPVNYTNKKILARNKSLKQHMKQKRSCTLKPNQILLPNIFAFKKKKINGDFFTKSITANKNSNSGNLSNTSEKVNKFNKTQQTFLQTNQSPVDTKKNSKHTTVTSIKKKAKNLQPDVIPITYNTSTINSDKHISEIPKCKVNSVYEKIQNDGENSPTNSNSETHSKNIKNSDESCKHKDTSNICVTGESSKSKENYEKIYTCKEQSNTNIENEVKNTVDIQNNKKKINLSKEKHNCKTSYLCKKNEHQSDMIISPDIANENNNNLIVLLKDCVKENTNSSERVDGNSENQHLDKKNIEITSNKNTEKSKQGNKSLEKSCSDSDVYLGDIDNQHLNEKNIEITSYKSTEKIKEENENLEQLYDDSDIETVILNFESHSSEPVNSASDTSLSESVKSSKQNSYKKKLRSSSIKQVNKMNVNITDTSSDESIIKTVNIKTKSSYKKKLRSFHRKKNKNNCSNTTQNLDKNNTSMNKEEATNILREIKKNTQDNLKEVLLNTSMLNKEPSLMNKFNEVCLILEKNSNSAQTICKSLLTHDQLQINLKERERVEKDSTKQCEEDNNLIQISKNDENNIEFLTTAINSDEFQNNREENKEVNKNNPKTTIEEISVFRNKSKEPVNNHNQKNSEESSTLFDLEVNNNYNISIDNNVIIHQLQNNSEKPNEVENDVFRKNNEEINVLPICEYNTNNILKSPSNNIQLQFNVEESNEIREDIVKNFSETISTEQEMNIPISYENSNMTTINEYQNNIFQNKNLSENCILSQFQKIKLSSQPSLEHHALTSSHEIINLSNVNKTDLPKNLNNETSQSTHVSKTVLKNDTNKSQKSNLTSNQNLEVQVKETKYNVKTKNIRDLMDPNKFKMYTENLPNHTRLPIPDENTYFLSCKLQTSYSPSNNIRSSQDTFYSLDSPEKNILTPDISGIQQYFNNNMNTYPQDNYPTTNESIFNFSSNVCQVTNGTELSDYLIEQDLNGLSLISQLK